MKRARNAFKLLSVTLATCALAAVLCSCEAIGMGQAGPGIPQVGQAKVASPAIAEDGILRVGVNAANAPFSTLVDGKMVGIDVDVAAALADEMGLRVKLVDIGATPELALENGTVDVCLGLDSADTSATCWLSDPYLETAVAIFATSSGAILPSVSSNPTIEAQESSMSAWEITNQYGEDALKAVPDLKTVFEDLENGATTYGASDAIIGSYVSHTSGDKAIIVGIMQKPGGYCAGVSSTNTDLRVAVTDAIAALVDKGVVGVIESKWIGKSLNLDAISLTENALAGNAAAEEEEDEDESEDKDKKPGVGTVGANAVELEDDGSTGEGNDAPVVVDGYWGGELSYTAPDTGYTDTGYVDTGYVDTGAGYTGGTDTGYVDPGTGSETGADMGYVDPGYVDTGDAGAVDATAGTEAAY